MLIILTAVPTTRTRLSLVRFRAIRAEWLNGYGLIPRETLWSVRRTVDTQSMETEITALMADDGIEVANVSKGDVPNLWLVFTV